MKFHLHTFYWDQLKHNKKIKILKLLNYLSFNLIYKEYAQKTEEGTKLFKFLVVIWGLYGVAAMTDLKTKNISYNILDIISKNFYGLYIYYQILQLKKSN